MRLLIVTQAVDRNDPVLGFFHRWIEEFAKHFERVYVVCLKEGEHALPANVSIHSLGKEKGRSLFKYLFRFYRLAWSLRHDYDAVFVHMNQEYVLLSGPLWRAMGKPVYLWRNHYAGSFLTRVSALFCEKIFCTSRSSYTARFAKTTLMPVGVDISQFQPSAAPARAPRSILFFARIAPSKRPELLVEALAKLKERGVQFSASFYGSALPQDAAYYENIKKEGVARLGGSAAFFPGQPHAAAPKIFASHDIFVNLSRSGMYDKTLFEAAASGSLVLAASRDFASLAGNRFSFEEDGNGLAERLLTLLNLPGIEKEQARAQMRSLAEHHSLASLAAKLAAELSL